MKIVYIRKKSFSFDHDLEKKKKGAQSARKLDRFEGWSRYTRISSLSLSKEEISHTANSGTVNQPPFNGHNKITQEAKLGTFSRAIMSNVTRVHDLVNWMTIEWLLTNNGAEWWGGNPSPKQRVSLTVDALSKPGSSGEGGGGGARSSEFRNAGPITAAITKQSHPAILNWKILERERERDCLETSGSQCL